MDVHTKVLKTFAFLLCSFLALNGRLLDLALLYTSLVLLCDCLRQSVVVLGDRLDHVPSLQLLYHFRSGSDGPGGVGGLH